MFFFIYFSHCIYQKKCNNDNLDMVLSNDYAGLSMCGSDIVVIFEMEGQRSYPETQELYRA